MERGRKRTAEVQIGTPAFCRRPYATRVLTPDEFYQQTATSWNALTSFVSSLPEKPLDVDISTEDVSFREEFHRWLREVKEEKGSTNDDALKPKGHHHRKERVLKEPLVTLDGVSRRQGAAALSHRTFGVDDIVEEAGNVLRSRVTPPRLQRGDATRATEPEEDTVEDVRTCLEKLASELSAPLEMITQKNTNLHGAPFRRNLFRMYRRIAKHLEECEGRVFEQPTCKRKKTVKRLDAQQAEWVREKIRELETKVPVVEEVLSQTRVQTPSPGTANEESEVLSEEILSDLSDSPQEPVLEIEIIHPSFLKSRGTCLLALGHHTLKEVIELCTCSCDDVMKALEESKNPRPVAIDTPFNLFETVMHHRYVFIEDVFYIDDDANEIILKDIEAIRDFCQAHGSGWPLEVTPNASCDFRVGSLSTPLKYIPLRASNKPLYLYAHRGGCEHLMHIRNVRLLHAGDDRALQFGPIRTRTAHVTVRKCSICEKTYAAYVVYASSMNTTDPCFYCETCYYLSHYDPSGVELHEAKGHVAYPYRGG